MKKILIIASLALCCSLLASCEDFLDTKKYGAKTDWETQEDVEKALVALFSFNTNDSEGVTGRGITWFECCSDDMTVGRPQGEAEDIRNFRMSPRRPVPRWVPPPARGWGGSAAEGRGWP